MAIVIGDPWNVEVPGGAIAGLIGESEAVLARVAPGPRHLRIADPLDWSPAPGFILDHVFALRDSVARAKLRMEVERLRRQGSAFLIVSQEQDLLAGLCDGIWWLDGDELRSGDPRDALESYNKDCARRLAESMSGSRQELAPSLRRGDGRARIVAVETPAVWRSGEAVSVVVRARFDAAAEDPVIGIMIRTRIGFEVYGTNTELEGIRLGPVVAGTEVGVKFEFLCALCPQEYTLTVASHDPDGVWHDWLEDAVALTVVGTRYTAGVADLRAKVSYQRSAASPVLQQV
ncbi:MAG: hypothetical protein FJW39_27715 [Acidobacteria bacterium]|nr:hypothetical protein [Acidobacteriota bacterium]